MELIIDNILISADMRDIINKIRNDSGRNLFSQVNYKGDNIMTCCPSHKDGQERHPSCSIYNSEAGDTEFGWFHCFTCGYSKPLWKVVADCFQEDYQFGKDWLKNNFGSSYISEIKILPEISFEKSTSQFLDESILKQFNHHTNYWLTRHISQEVVDRFEVGYDIENDMVVFPVRDAKGRLVMLTKRSTHTKFFQIDEEKQKPVYLLNHILKEDIDTVYIAESQINALQLWTWGYPAVALIGTGTPDQFKELNRSGIRHFILAYDGDEAGDKGTKRFCKAMSSDKLISKKVLPRDKDVNDLTKEEFDNLKVEFL